MTHGGRRQNAGRKKASHTIAAEKAREFVINKVTSELDPIITAQIERAKGISIMTADGVVYTKEPDRQAAEFLLNQVIGKAKEIVEMGGIKDGQSIPIDIKRTLDLVYGSDE